MRRYTLFLFMALLPTFIYAQGFDQSLDWPIHLGMERIEAEHILGGPLFSVAQDFEKKSTENGDSVAAVSYSFYEVHSWQDNSPAYVLVFFLDGYVMRVLGFYREPAYEALAWKIAENKNLLRGKKGIWEYYKDKNFPVYYIMEKIQKTNMGPSLLNGELRERVLQVLGTQANYYLVMHHDEDLFGLLYQALEDLNFLTTLFEKLLSNKNKPGGGQPSPQEEAPRPLPEEQDLPPELQVLPPDPNEPRHEDMLPGPESFE